MSADELTHTLKHIVEQQVSDRKPFAYAHIATYDPKTGAVKVIYPSIRNEDGTPTMSPWMPLSTAWAGPSGKSYGFQYAPYGGASLEEPTAGEQVIVDIIDSVYGTSFAASLVFNAKAPPPRADLLPGEFVFQNDLGSVLRFHQIGDIEINSVTNINLIAEGRIKLEAPVTETTGNLSAGNGITASFSTPTGQTVMVQNGIITNIF